ncbi:MAG: hypothetical protein RL664_874, partial [Bacteroidota bacterium]
MLTVNALPTVTLSAPNGGLFCGTQQMTASGADTYVWSPAASLSSNTGTSVTFTGTSNVSVSVTGTDANGCQAASTAQAITYSTPTAITIASSVPNFCGTGGTAVITATSDAAYSYTFESLDGAVLSNTTANSVDATIIQTSAIRVTGYDASTGCSAQAVTSVGVYPLPEAVVSTTANGVCPGTQATINSGLSAGNFTAVCITPRTTLSTPPSSAVTLCENGVATTTLNGGSLDDGYWNNRPIGFNFNWFTSPPTPGQTQVMIGTNGTILVGGGTSTQFNFTGGFPNAVNPANCIAACARDLRLGFVYGAGTNAIRYWTEGVAPNRRFVVQYANCATWYSTNANDGKSSVEVVLYETLGTVEIFVIQATNPAATTGTWINDTRNKFIGLQDGTRTIGATAPNCGSPFQLNYWNGISNEITSPLGWRFSPPSNYFTSWSATDANGTVAVTNNVDGSAVTTINGFSATVAPSITTTYSIFYANATTGCSNASNPQQVTMAILGTVAPTGVSATSTVAAACPGVNIPLTTSYTGSLDGLSFQWQVSTDGGANWSDISGAISATYTATQTIASSYRLGMSSCGGTVEYSAPVAIALTSFLDCFCASNATDVADEEISNVTVGAVLNNSSDCNTTAPGAGSVLNQYSNYTTLPAGNLLPGLAYPISVTQTTCGGNYTNIIGAWIDYNHNGSFTDAGEQILLGTATTGNQTALGNFTVPFDAATGLTRMRVVAVEASTVSPCGTYTWGETEDYYVNIIGSCDPAVFSAPSATANELDGTVCGTQVSALTANDGNGLTTPIYMWYDAPVAGNLLQNSSSNTYTTGPISATT